MCVRSSIAFYGNFNLDMDRSPGFGSTLTDSATFVARAIHTWFPFGFSLYDLNLASKRNSPDRSTKSTRLHFNVLPQIVNIGFQVLFHSPPGVLFTFPSRYFSTIGHQVVFSLTGWSPLIHTRFHVSCTTLDTALLTYLLYTRLSLSMVYFSK